jgi:hypothetical protein
MEEGNTSTATLLGLFTGQLLFCVAQFLILRLVFKKIYLTPSLRELAMDEEQRSWKASRAAEQVTEIDSEAL